MDAAALHDVHATLLAQIRDLGAALGRDTLPAEDLAWRMRELGCRLKQHFAAERRSLYGRLLEESDPTTRALVLVCQSEARAAEAALEAFLRHWIVPLHIQRDPEGFRRAARDLFARVGRRTGAEERDLLPRLRMLAGGLSAAG